MTSKRYEESLKQETVKYIVENRKSVAQVARETGVNENTLHGWVKKYSEQPAIQAVQTFATPSAEIKAMQKKLRELEEENEILKKAMHYFAKSPR